MRKSYLLALGIALAATLWMLSGEIGWLAGSAGGTVTTAAAPEPAAEAPLPAVRVTRSTAVERTREVVARGRTAAKRKVELRAELEGRVVELPVQKGARVQAGDVLARLAVDDREARLAEARALVSQRQIEFEAATQLSEKGYRAETQLAAAKAQLDSAKAMVMQREVELAKTVIRAPFAGIVNDRPAEIGDYLKNGDAVATLVDEEPFLIVANVSETDVGRLQPGATGSAVLVTGETVEGRISFISATAEPETRTFRVELEVPNAEHSLREGVTAELRFPTDNVQAHLISPAVLTLNDAGVIGVRTVDEAGTVDFVPAQIVDDQADGVWLAGLPAIADIIVVGQEFVREGQRVQARPANGGSAS